VRGWIFRSRHKRKDWKRKEAGTLGKREREKEREREYEKKK